MKKIYLSIFGLFFGFSLISQNLNSTIHSVEKVEGTPHALISKNNNNTNRATNIDEWLNFSSYYDQLYFINGYTNWGLGNGFALTNDSNELFQVDTGTMQYVYQNSGIYSVGRVFPLSGFIYRNTLFNPGLLPYDPATSVTVDSIEIYGNYVKVDALVTDTLVVVFTERNGTSFSYPGYLYDVDGNTSIDTVYYPALVWDPTNKKYDTESLTVKIPLTAGIVDSVGTGSFTNRVAFDVPTGATFNAGDVFGVSYSFKPGKVITSSDTMGLNANVFIPGIAGFDQTTTYPFYETIPSQFNINDLWTSHWLIGNDYYGIDASPTTLALPWSYNRTGNSIGNFDEVLIDIKIQQNNSLNASIDELSNGAKIEQNYPNPTNGMTTVKYSLEEAAEISFEVIDITGKVVFASNEGNKSNGVHVIDIDTKDFNAGVYFYSVIVNGSKLTKKMTVSK